MTVAADRSAWTRYAATGLFVLLIATLLVGLLVPVYTDEVAWRFQLSRYLIDGGVDRATGETCGANTLATPAFFMLPVRVFSSGVTALMLGPLSVRVTGVTLAIVAMFGLRGLIRQHSDEPHRRALLDLTVFGLLGMGVLPFLLIWSRPEQPVLLAVLAALLLGFRYRGGRWRHDGERPALVVAIVLLAAIAFSYHLKALFYLPIFVLAVWLTGGRRIWIRSGAVVLLIVLAGIDYRYWAARFACPDDPILAAKLARENAAVLLLHGGLGDMVRALPAILNDMLPTNYIRPVEPASDYMSQWLPPARLPAVPLGLWRAATAVAWWGAFALALALVARALRDPARAMPPLLAGVVLLGCVTAWAALQLNKNAYECALYLPLVALAVLLLWVAGKRDARWMTPVAWIIGGLSVASQALLIASYAAPLWAASRAGGYIAAQPYSLGAFSYPRARILAAGAKCGIGPRTPRVLIDDLTYFAFARSMRPLHRMGVLSDWNGSTGDPLRWLHDHGSPGAVTACAYLPPAMRARAVASGPLCCVDTR